MSFISYAQNFEDVMLWRALRHVTAGRYIELGARTRVDASASLAFYERGWRGSHAESDAQTAHQLRTARPGDLVIHCAIGDADRALRTSVLTLDQLLERAGDTVVHWLKIGANARAVLQSWRHSPVRPWIIVVDSIDPLTRQPSHAAWEPLLLAKDYQFAYFDGVHRFYVCAAHPELAAALAGQPVVGPARPGALSPAKVHAALLQSEQLATQLERQRRQLADELARQAACGQREIAGLHEKIHALYASTSWQVTKPLRWLSRLRRTPGPAMAELAALPARSMRRATRQTLTHVRAGLLRRPVLRRHALALAQRFPAAAARLKQLSAPAAAPAPATTSAAPPVWPVNLVGPQFDQVLAEAFARNFDQQHGSHA